MGISRLGARFDLQSSKVDDVYRADAVLLA